MLRLLARLVPVVLAVATVALSPSAEASPDPAPRPHQVGRWSVDPQGRVLVLHGLNMVYKVGSYAPDEIGFGADDARFLKRNGFTTVRLGLIWGAVEPRPGEYDDAYLARIRRTAEVLAAEGIWVLLDFHQDLYHERFEGEGAPTWAVLDNGLPAQPQLGFPYNYFVQPGLNAAFDSFWSNAEGPGGVGLQDRYAAAWAHTASYFRDVPGILGLDLFNEPWPGTDYPTCINPVGCPGFDAELTAFSERAIDAIREVDPRSTIYYEPNVMFNNGVATHVRPEGRNLGFSFHDYCLVAETGLEELGIQGPVCDVFDDIVFDNTDAHVAATGHAPLLTEFGATDDLTTITTMVDRAMEHRIGWQYWAYCGCSDPTTTGENDTQALVLDPAKAPTGDNVRQEKLEALAVPHPTVVAGTPLAYTFDRTERTFTFRYTPAKAGALRGRFAAGSVTRVAVPAVHFPDGYDVEVAGARVVSAEDAPVLKLALRRGASEVGVTVTPR